MLLHLKWLSCPMAQAHPAPHPTGEPLPQGSGAEQEL